MATKKPRIIGLDDYQLSQAGLRQLGDRPVHLSVQLIGRSVSALQHLAPPQRDARLREALAEQLVRLRRRLPAIEFISRGKRRPSWTIDAIVPARHVVQVAGKPEVDHVQIDTIEGRRRKPRRPQTRWFCVWGIVAIQVEGRDKGLIEIEDRLVLVRATDSDDARHRLQRKWEEYAEPYLNPHGYLVRWQLVEIRHVYELFDDTIDPRGTEVFSRLRKVRLRPEHRWMPTESTKRTRLTMKSKS